MQHYKTEKSYTNDLEGSVFHYCYSCRIIPFLAGLFHLVFYIKQNGEGSEQQECLQCWVFFFFCLLFRCSET